MEDPADNLTDLGSRELNARLASREPIPGGGSASALAGAMGASLVAMVAELTIPRAGSPEVEAQLADMRDRAVDLQRELLDLAEEDARAYAAVVSARRLPRDSEHDRQARAEVMRRAMVGAADAPLRTARVATAVLRLARDIAPTGNPNAVSDAGVAGELAAAAVHGAILNVRINLPYLAEDDPVRAAAPAELDLLSAQADDLAREISAAVAARMEPS
jgi:formiminotetrahydrofolate cyclodeaminase